ncbi:MAG: CHAT domain-containing protein, partial [Bacteroidota bacterium]
NDGYLETREIFDLNLQGTDMVVLQACETGDGILDVGEGLNTMARGFFFAGVPSVVAGLWEIDESASAKLTHSLYETLAEGHTNVASLASAKRDYLQHTHGKEAHPYYWAGMIFLGDERNIPLDIQQAFPATLWWVTIGLTLFLFSIWYQKRRTSLLS